jgi:hypothetical protein
MELYDRAATLYSLNDSFGADVCVNGAGTKWCRRFEPGERGALRCAEGAELGDPTQRLVPSGSSLVACDARLPGCLDAPAEYSCGTTKGSQPCLPGGPTCPGDCRPTRRRASMTCPSEPVLAPEVA